MSVYESYSRDYPIDKVIEKRSNHSIHVLKFIAFNEEIFKEHFINNPVYPGSLIMNSVLAAGKQLIQDSGALDGFEVQAIKKASFRKKCTPGDLLDITLTVQSIEEQMKINFLVKSYFEQEVIANGTCFYGR